METKKLFAKSKEDIKAAADILKNGGIVAIPTETVYGLAADAFNADAIKAVFKAKGRPQDNPLIVHISDISQIYDIAAEFSNTAKKCAESFWPGPFTMILPKKSSLPDTVSAGLDTVAVRMPKSITARQIINLSGPLAAPSANTSGSPSPTSAQHVVDDLGGKIDAVVIGDDCDVGVESTVVSLVSKNPVLLRPGGVTLEMLACVLPNICVDPAVENKLNDGAKVLSPGLKYKHYAPKTKLILVEGSTEQFVNFINSKANGNQAALVFDEEKDLIKIPVVTYGSAQDDAQKAKQIFLKLRQIDSLNVSAVFVHAPQKTGIGLAVYNRLIRAAAFKVIKL